MAQSTLELILRTKKTGTGIQDAAQDIKGLGQAVFSAFSQFAIAEAALRSFAELIKWSVKEASEAEQADVRLAGVLKSTGGVAGMTAEELDKLATSLSRMTTYEDDAIKSAEAVMLTFTKVGKEVFPQAIQAAMDLSSLLGTDLQSSVIQVGKALNDPVQGITALRRVGVSFTEDQMDMIKALIDSNQQLEAQRLILSELNTEFGGQAAAQVDTFAGSWERLKNAIGEGFEDIGSEILPSLKDLFNWLADDIYEMRDFQDQYEKSTIGYGRFFRYASEDAKKKLEDLKEATIKFGYASEGVKKKLEDLMGPDGPLEGTAKDMEKMGQAAEYAAGQISLLVGALGALKEALSLPKLETKLLAEGIAAIAKSALDQAKAAELLALADRNLSERQREVIMDQYRQVVALVRLNEAAEKGAVSLERYIGIIADGRITMQEYFGYSKEARLEAEKATRTWDDNAKLLYETNLRLGDAAGAARTLDNAFRDVKDTTASLSPSIANMAGKIDSLPESKTITITYIEEYITIYRTITGGGGGGDYRKRPSDTKTPAWHLQRGGEFVVPEGFPYDNFLMGVSSGERVIVMPRGTTKSEGITVNVYFGDVYGGGPQEAISKAVQTGLLAALRAKGMM